jgi:prepilin signal peptidase PulO-like enzyme (type II secretory pathway)
MQMLLPFGIFLGLGALLSLLFGRPLVDWYMSQF